MQSYIGDYNRYLESFQHSVLSSSQDSKLQSLMHSLPTNTTLNQTNFFGTLTHSSAIRNSYLNPSIGDDCNDQIKSAFKPVKPRISINPIMTILPRVRNNNFDLSLHTSSEDSKDTSKLLPDSLYASSYESCNHTNLTSKSSDWSTNYEKRTERKETNFRMAFKYVADNSGQVGAVYHWDTLLPVLPEKKTYKILPPRQKRTRIQHHQKFKAFHHQISQFEDNSVPIIIDLTAEQEQTDKIQENVQNLKVTKISELDETQSIDVNKNDKMIIKQKHQADDSSEQLSNILHVSETNLNGIVFKSNEPKDKISMGNHKMVCGNFRYSNGIRMPPKKQIKLTTKHNQWQKQIRTYNGFRLFARRNQSHAKEHTTESDNESIVNNVLVKWWNTASASEKEHYAQVAEENQSRSTSAVSTDEKKIQNVFEGINTIPNQECAKSSNELPIDIVYEKKTDTKMDSIDRENESYSTNDNDNNSFFQTIINPMDKSIQMR